MLGVQKKQMISFNKLAGLFAGLLCFIALNALLIISKPEGTHGNTSSSLAKIASPFYFFTEDEAEAKQITPVSQPREVHIASIVNHVETKKVDGVQAVVDFILSINKYVASCIYR